MSGLSGSPSSRRGPSSSAAVAEYLQQADDDDVVCSFGPDFFRGASAGAFAGSLFTAALSWWTFRTIKADQQEVDFRAGLRKGQHNPHFSRWTILRGLRTQPMLTVGCVALATTSTMKCAKCALATARCREFFQDDIEFAQLLESSSHDPKAAALVEKIQSGSEAEKKPLSPLATKSAAVVQRSEAAALSPVSATQPGPSSSSTPGRSGATMQSLLATHRSRASDATPARLIHRCPTFWDGIAVALLGSVMDCYLPQKPVTQYYRMRAGL